MSVASNPDAPPRTASLEAVVVVPARDEESLIEECLAALASQQGIGPTSFEVILVLDGCRDGTLAVANRVAEDWPQLQVVVLEASVGVGRARRIGMDLAYDRLAATECEDGLIATTDADTIVAEDWLAAQLRLVDTGAQAIGGLIELNEVQAFELHPDALELRRQRARKRIIDVRERSEMSDVPVEHPHFAGASLSLTASAYRRCGGMPVRAALEDEALADALEAQRIKIHRSSLVRVRTSARVTGRAPRGLAHDLARADWRARHSFASDQFPLERLLAAKRETVALILPAREVGQTIGAIAKIARDLQLAGLLDEVVVVDANSRDNTVAAAEAAGALVLQENDLAPECGPARGKGDAMWRGLRATSSDLVVYADTDTERFHEGFVLGMVGPLICNRETQMVKGTFRRPFRSGGDLQEHGGGRVTELMARPLLNLHAPELAVFDQPLAGETAARRSLLEQISFSAGYGVEIGMLIDAWRITGLEGLAQVDLGVRQNRHQSLRDLSAMAYAVLVTAQSRLLGPGFADANACGSIVLPPPERGGAMETRPVSLDERPPVHLATGALRTS